MKIQHARMAIVCLAASVAWAGAVAAPDKQDDAAKLGEYEVGASKKVKKDDAAVAKVERPKAVIDTGFQMEKQKFEIAPMVVAPMQVSAPPAATSAVVPAAKPAPSKPVAAAPVRTPSPAGSTAAIPQAAPARPTGAVPQAGGGEITLVPISTPAPEYPREASINGTTGYVVIAFTLNVEGAPQDITIVESSPPRVFDQSARRAVARWRFQPVVVDGQPVERKVQRRIDFK